MELIQRIYNHKKYAAHAGIFILFWTLSFYVSTRLLMRETQEIVVPKVIGFPMVEAERMLKQRGLDFKVEKFQETVEYPANTVLAQSVEAGTIVKENRTLLLYVSKQSDQVEIPNLVDKDFFEAKKIVEKFNLKLTNVAYGCSKKIKAGRVTTQNPLHEELGKNRNIQLLISSGPCQNQFVIGDLVDRKVDLQLKREFSDKDIDLKQVTTQGTRDNLKKARVISQEPIAGSIVKSGDHVVLNME